MGGKPEVALRSMIDNFNNKIYADPEISQLLEDYEANSGYTFSDPDWRWAWGAGPGAGRGCRGCPAWCSPPG